MVFIGLVFSTDDAAYSLHIGISPRENGSVRIHDVTREKKHGLSSWFSRVTLLILVTNGPFVETVTY